MSSSPSGLEQDPFGEQPRRYVRTWHGVVQSCGPTLRFLTRTEAHVYAFSIAANVLLSFFPFLLTLLLICRQILHWQAGVRAILFSVGACFPDFRNSYIDMPGLLLKAAQEHGHISLLSLFLLFFTANGIFEPLEVALNRAWRVKRNRSYVMNQLVSLGLIFLCGVLVLIAVTMFAWNGDAFSHSLTGTVSMKTGRLLFFKLISIPTFSLIIFFVYWILPNCRIPAVRLIPASVLVGIALALLGYLNLVTWPWLFGKLRYEMGPFVHSASIVLWSFVAALIVLAGAEWSARISLSEEVLACD